MRWPRIATALGLAGLLLSAACSSGDDAAGPATPAPTPTVAARPGDPDPDDLTLVSLNLLHGLACPPESNACDAPNRVALFGQLVEAAGCPDVVALQEIDPRIYGLISELRKELCGGEYEEAWVPDVASDRELVLTAVPVLGVERVQLAGPLRTALWARLRTRVGVVDLVVTHTGAGSDSQARGGAVCTRLLCKPPCQPGEPMVTCQVTQVRDLLKSKRGADSVGLLVGDLNVAPGSAPYRLLADAGLVDTYLAAGNPECDPASGVGCTGGRPDTNLDALRDLSSRENERIDYAWLVTHDGCAAQFDTGVDGDGDGVPTGLFADKPATEGPAGLVWASDHVGVAVDLSCR